jgi:hypothetical protein
LTEIAIGTNIRLKRISCNVLLCGPTSIDQVKCTASPDQMSVKILVKLPATFLNERRTAVWACEASNLTAHLAPTDVNGINIIVDKALGYARVQSHKNCVLKYKKQNKGLVEMDIPLPCKVDKLFCHRNDFGRETAYARGVSVATYQHDDMLMQIAGQFVYILHIEMTGADREGETEAQSRADIRTFHTFA